MSDEEAATAIEGLAAVAWKVVSDMYAAHERLTNDPNDDYLAHAYRSEGRLISVQTIDTRPSNGLRRKDESRPGPGTTRSTSAMRYCSLRHRLSFLGAAVILGPLPANPLTRHLMSTLRLVASQFVPRPLSKAFAFGMPTRPAPAFVAP